MLPIPGGCLGIGCLMLGGEGRPFGGMPFGGIPFGAYPLGGDGRPLGRGPGLARSATDGIRTVAPPTHLI
jgi:hypothetical protein